MSGPLHLRTEHAFDIRINFDKRWTPAGQDASARIRKPIAAFIEHLVDGSIRRRSPPRTRCCAR